MKSKKLHYVEWVDEGCPDKPVDLRTVPQELRRSMDAHNEVVCSRIAEIDVSDLKAELAALRRVAAAALNLQDAAVALMNGIIDAGNGEAVDAYEHYQACAAANERFIDAARAAGYLPGEG